MFRFGHSLYNNAYGSGGAPVVDNDFVIQVKTDNAGTSASNQFTIPTSGGGYNYNIETSEHSLTGQTGSVTLTFSTAGEYVIRISGTFPRIYFNNGGDRLKLIYIYNFGDVGWTNMFRSFYGCSNMVIDASATGNFTSVTNFNTTWRNCTSLTSFPVLDLSSGIDFISTWSNCSSLTSFPALDLSSGTNFLYTWYNCSFTSFPELNLSSGTNFSYTWWSCSSLTSFPALDLSAGATFLWTWRQCGVISSFATRNFYNMTNGTNCFNGTTLSTSDYSDILITQNANNPNTGVPFHGGNSTYNASATIARTNLVSVKSWTITDAGLV